MRYIERMTERFLDHQFWTSTVTPASLYTLGAEVLDDDNVVKSPNWVWHLLLESACEMLKLSVLDLAVAPLDLIKWSASGMILTCFLLRHPDREWLDLEGLRQHVLGSVGRSIAGDLKQHALLSLAS